MSDARRRGRECVSCRAVSERGLCVVRGPRFIIYPTAPAFDETSMVLQGGSGRQEACFLGHTKRSADKKAQSRTVPSMAEEELGDGVNPMGDVPKSVSRANFSHIKAMEENHQKASAVRAEHNLRQQQLAEQRERFRQRGIMLRAQRAQSQELIKDTIEGCHARAHTLGERSRQQRERLRLQRESRAAQWQEHGRQLTMEHTQLRERLRKTQADEVKARTDDATQLKASLKKLNQMTDDTIMMVNTERVQRVKAETGEAVMRHAKQTFLNDRWNRADELRAQMEELRRRQRANEQQYMDHAHQTKQRAKQATDLAHKMQKEAQMQEALELRAWEKRMAAEYKASKEAETHRKRQLHETMEADKLVPDNELQRAVAAVAASAETADPELSSAGDTGPAAMFSRFFGFRKRGSGHHLTSVAI